MQLEAVAKARDWTAGMAAYDLVLAKMKPVSAALDSSSKELSAEPKKKKRKQPEPAAASVATAPAPQPAVAKTAKTKTKKSKKHIKTPCDSEAVTSTIVAPLAQQPVVMPAAATITLSAASVPAQQAKGRHVGRYHRVAAAKKAKGYSSSDLAAVLGLTALPTAPSAAVPIAQVSCH